MMNAAVNAVEVAAEEILPKNFLLLERSFSSYYILFFMHSPATHFVTEEFHKYKIHFNITQTLFP